MRLTAMGKLMIFIMAVGLAIGGWRAWQNTQQGAGSKAGGKSGGQGSGQTAGSGVEIRLLTSASKKGWLQEQVERFNAAHEGKWRVTTDFLETREAMHAILDGKATPVLWSPSSTLWAVRLEEAWAQKHQNRILDTGDSKSHRVFLRTPLVFLTTKQKARFLKPLLSSPDAWSAVRDLSLGRRKVPWGRFKFAHADPLTANSGMMTLGLILFDYGQRTGQSASLTRVAEDKKFLDYLAEMERKLIYDSAVEKGSSALAQAFAEDTSRYDFITNYENSALEAVTDISDLFVIYPNPTAVSEHAVSLLSGDWVTPEQRAGAEAFMEFLGSKESLQSGMKYHFRPAQAGSGLSLASEISRYQAHGFQQSFSSIELPPYEALNSAAFGWRIHIARKPPTT